MQQPNSNLSPSPANMYPGGVNPQQRINTLTNSISPHPTPTSTPNSIINPNPYNPNPNIMTNNDMTVDQNGKIDFRGLITLIFNYITSIMKTTTFSKQKIVLISY